MEHFDVVVIGAGISGIDAAYHLQTMCPNRSYVILEGRDDLGGTWDLFRYPGVRSDSDMHTLGFGFKPWNDAKSIADGPSILAYLRETATEFGIDQHIRFRHRAGSAEWSTADATWTVHARRGDTDEDVTFTCNFLFLCSGYYSYRTGHDPGFEGRDRFHGQVIHPQEWPDDLDYQGKHVVVIGSGATAMTLVPALAASGAGHVTMLQRSPTYVVSRPDEDVIANTLRKVLPDKLAYDITRFKNTRFQQVMYNKIREKPDDAKRKLVGMVRNELGPDFDVDKHFTPTYAPWDQRLCLIPNGDLYESINAGTASVVTDTIDTFIETGIRLDSGDDLDADIIVTATGLSLVTLGEMDFTLDGDPIDFSQSWTYKGLAYSDVPNLAMSFGYIAASWTLRADLTCRFVGRLLNHMEETGAVTCTPRLRPGDEHMRARPWIDDFSAGYIQRMLPAMPKQGDRDPWVNSQNYKRDKQLLVKAPIDDGVMQFSRPAGDVDETGGSGLTERHTSDPV